MAPPTIKSEAVRSRRKAGKAKSSRKPAPAAPAPEETEAAPASGPAPEAGAAQEAPAAQPKRKPRKRKPVRKKPAARPRASSTPTVDHSEGMAAEAAAAAPAAAQPKAGAKKSAPDDPDESARITASGGFVETRAAGKKEWREVPASGGEIKTGDRVQTYADAKVRAEFHEGSKVELSPFSVMSLEKDKFDHIAVGLFQGKVTAQVSWRAQRKFEVRAPGAAVVARADERFSVSATSDRRVRVEVEKGEVSVYAVGAKKTLKAAERVEIVSGRMGPVELFGPAFTAPPEEAPRPGGEPAQEPEGEGEAEAPEPRAAKRGPAVKAPGEAGFFRAEVEREVQRSLARDAVESAVVFDARATQYQEGHVLVDANGGRVRVEEYITRPDPKSFKLITLNGRGERVDYGILQVEANAALPTELYAAGNLFYSPTSAKPAFWAVKYLWTQSNSIDTVTRIGVDGDALAVSLIPEPVFNTETGRYDAPAVRTAYQTFFGNLYEFADGASAGIQRIYTDPAFRPADNGTLAGTAVTGMLARLQPVEVQVRDVAVPGTVLAAYYDYSFITLDPTDASGNATGKAAVVDQAVPESLRSRFVEAKRYVNFRDTNGNGVLDFAEDAEAGTGCSYGDCSVAAVFHDKVSRRDGTATVALPGAGCQGTDAACLSNAGDTHFFSDTDNDGIVDVGESAVVGVTGARDAALLAFAAASPRAFIEEDRVTLDDRGGVVWTRGRPDESSTSGYDQVADLFERGILERRVSGSMFTGGKLDLVMTPTLHLVAGLLSPETGDARASAAGGRGIVW
ncbi:MAG: FecR domain-containing protein [Elusimicrobia bacterium]|nr:FecR domain-containing protein [Elusimicrobiota bacterium]